MRIGLNAQLFPHGPTYRSTGVAVYVKELVRHLPQIAPQHEYTFFVPPGVSGAGTAPSRLPTQHPVVRLAWEQLLEPLEARRRHLDLVHSPVNVSPALLATPSVVTLHDLSFFTHPDRFVASKRQYQRLMARRSVLRANRVIVPSASTKEDTVGAFGIEPDKVIVVPHGVDQRFHRDPAFSRPIAGPYILHVGTIEPRKNIPVLLEAFAKVKAAGHPHLLALVGPRGWMYEEVDRAITRLGLQAYIVRPDYVEELAPWYNHADFFVYPSAYEGFGLPPLEAMACGTPVVLSSGGSLREIAGDAAILVEPSDIPGLTSAMLTLLADDALRRRLSESGLSWASRFTWDETARRTVEVYESAVDGG